MSNFVEFQKLFVTLTTNKLYKLWTKVRKDMFIY